jgi:Secreted Novel AID/APOBEC-like Deaminase 4
MTAVRSHPSALLVVAEMMTKVDTGEENAVGTMKQFVVNPSHVEAMQFCKGNNYYPQSGAIYTVQQQGLAPVTAGPYRGVYLRGNTIITNTRDGNVEKVGSIEGHVEMCLLGMITKKVEMTLPTTLYLFTYYSPCGGCSDALKKSYSPRSYPNVTFKLAFAQWYTRANCSTGANAYADDAAAIAAMDELAQAGWTTRLWGKHGNFRRNGFDRKNKEFTNSQKDRISQAERETDAIYLEAIHMFELTSTPGTAGGNNPGAF